MTFPEIDKLDINLFYATTTRQVLVAAYNPCNDPILLRQTQELPALWADREFKHHLGGKASILRGSPKLFDGFEALINKEVAIIRV